MGPTGFKIFIIDDDAAVCRGISLLLRSAGKEVECFPDLSEFLLYTDHPGPGCILLDVFFGERSALEKQSEISARFPHLPIIFIRVFTSCHLLNFVFKHIS
jgi:FixJ family two-component response regulator